MNIKLNLAMYQQYLINHILNSELDNAWDLSNCDWLSLDELEDIVIDMYVGE
jgi:hypothetical protein